MTRKRKSFWIWFICLSVGLPIVSSLVYAFLAYLIFPLAVHHPGILGLLVFISICYLLAELFSE